MLLFLLANGNQGCQDHLIGPWNREGGLTMRASTFTTLVAALGFSVAGAAAALAGEYRGPLDSVNTGNNTITVMGVTIQAKGYPIGNLDPTASYIVSWEKQGNQNVL